MCACRSDRLPPAWSSSGSQHTHKIIFRLSVVAWRTWNQTNGLRTTVTESNHKHPYTIFSLYISAAAFSLSYERAITTCCYVALLQQQHWAQEVGRWVDHNMSQLSYRGHTFGDSDYAESVSPIVHVFQNGSAWRRILHEISFLSILFFNIPSEIWNRIIFWWQPQGRSRRNSRTDIWTWNPFAQTRHVKGTLFFTFCAWCMLSPW